MNGVKVTKTVVGAIQVGQNPRHVCLIEGVCFVVRVSTGSAVQQQQCSSVADKGWRFVPDAILLGGHRRAPSGRRQGHPRYTGARSAPRLWVARQDQIADTRQT